MPTNQQRREAAKRKLDRQRARRAERLQRRKQVATIVAVAVVVLVVGAVLALSLRTSNPSTPASNAAAAPPGACSFPASPDEPASRPVSAPTNVNPAKTGTVNVSIATNNGALPITLNRAQAPCTVENFVSLAKAGFYNNTPCHRLVTSEGLKVLQCGDPTGSGSGGPGYTIPDEKPTGLRPGPDGASVYPAGTVAMAKTSAPNSGGSQFFLVYADSYLPPDYTVFGTIAPAGLQVLQEVAAAGDDDSNGPGDGKPKLATTLQSVTVS